MPELAFDAAAKAYDHNFTHSKIGRVQRALVWKRLLQDLDQHQPTSILEINCGTGEDALQLHNLGYQVTATDISPEMVTVAKQKVSSGVDFRVLGFSELRNAFSPQSFDLVFSNFAGLNCVSEDELVKLSEDFHTLLKPNGVFIGVYLGKYCWVERLYFSMKGSRKKAKRRQSKSLANIDGVGEQWTFCYAVDELKTIFREFAFKCTRPIGFFIPPSFFETSIGKRTWLIAILGILERCVGWISWLSDSADHMYVKFEKA